MLIETAVCIPICIAHAVLALLTLLVATVGHLILSGPVLSLIRVHLNSP
ncbi:MAG: hypothetical protein WD114_06170 [Phycisphaerales bacterium]